MTSALNNSDYFEQCYNLKLWTRANDKYPNGLLEQANKLWAQLIHSLPSPLNGTSTLLYSRLRHMKSCKSHVIVLLHISSVVSICKHHSLAEILRQKFTSTLKETSSYCVDISKQLHLLVSIAWARKASDARQYSRHNASWIETLDGDLERERSRKTIAFSY